jgi:hypothetical protein
MEKCALDVKPTKTVYMIEILYELYLVLSVSKATI